CRQAKVDGLLRSFAKFSDKLRVAEATKPPDIQAEASRQWGPALVFGRLWEEQGQPTIIEQLSVERRLESYVEQACFPMALQRLYAPGSDLQGSHWVDTGDAPGFEKLALQHFYRTALFRAEVRHDMESELCWKDLDLFSQDYDVMFIDSTSLYVYRDRETDFFKRGYARHHRPDLTQVVLCAWSTPRVGRWRGRPSRGTWRTSLH
ncbi:MAG: hypothetical protein FJY85_22570, partial [Deltaproteobacteria bacterium]|nr:hypothetical protein [Deltaproteobacteria bacterium]